MTKKDKIIATISQRLKQQLKIIGLNNNKDIAEICGVTTKTISFWLNGNQTINSDALISLYDYNNLFDSNYILNNVTSDVNLKLLSDVIQKVYGNSKKAATVTIIYAISVENLNMNTLEISTKHLAFIESKIK